MQRLFFFSNYFFITLPISQQEDMLMLLYLRNLMRWWAEYLHSAPSPCTWPRRMPPWTASTGCPALGLDLVNGQEEHCGWSVYSPSPSLCVHCGFLCPSKKPQFLSCVPLHTAVSISLHQEWRQGLVLAWGTAPSRVCLPKPCPHLCKWFLY